MNFFERQRAARGASARLVALFIISVIAMVAIIDLVVYLVLSQAPRDERIGWLISVAVITLVIIGIGMLWKTVQLRAGGSAVALSTGAVAVDPTTTDPKLRRLNNIIEEMSLASGVPMPKVFVLSSEPGINAFAAGYTPADAAITVTDGALQQLNRAELQGVIGHEFSHILNGDMRLNIRMIALLNGILLMSLIGLRIFAFGGMSGGRSRDRNNNGAAVVLLIALAMVIVGAVGQFFAAVIKAAVSRHRERLADASSVQFTRDPQGLAGALKKIGGLRVGSQLRDKRSASEVSHMLFGEGARSALAGLFATHPPLIERIRALEPDFNPEQLQGVPEGEGAISAAQEAGLTAGFAPRTAHSPQPARKRVSAGTAAPAVPGTIAGQVGAMAPEYIEQGSELSGQIPPQYRTLAGQPTTAVPLVVAMLLANDASAQAGQLGIVQQSLGTQFANTTADLRGEMAALPLQLRLPLVSLAAPVITSRPGRELDQLRVTLDRLAEYDGTITLFEYCLTRLVASYVDDARSPARRSRPGTLSAQAAWEAATVVLAALAAVGNDDPAAAGRAFNTAIGVLAGGVSTATTYQQALSGLGTGWRVLDEAWSVLDQVEPRSKERLVAAMVAAVRDDGVLTLNEAELLRSACALLHCPLPAFVA